jgi:16S rRNA (adenine1518-N6/adenine1519-N6)-dimethyltransferase
VFAGCRRGAGPEQAGPRSWRRADRQRVHGQSFSSSGYRLRALGLRPRKRLSQSFLEDQRIAAAIVRAARVDSETDVLEVGPGLGVLTRLLARRARRVIAVELDSQLAQALRQQLPVDTVEVVEADILAFDPSTAFQRAYTVVANLPYHITSPAVRHLLGSGPPFAHRLVLMVQAEVAARISAVPGAMSALAVAIQAQAHVKMVRRVKAEAFYPRPKVDSAVLLLEPLLDAERLIQRHELTQFTSLVQAGFKQPRKTLANSLADGLGVARAQAIERLERASIDPGLRPQALALDDWVRLFRTA